MKSIESASEQELKVYQRIASLDEETQRRISLKYYRGTRPWLPAANRTQRSRRKKDSPSPDTSTKGIGE